VPEDRRDEFYLFDLRHGRVDSYSLWKDRIQKARRLARGEFTYTTPDRLSHTDEPAVMNLAEVMPRDVARLVSETTPTVRAYPHNDSTSAQDAAYVREVIADTHWEMNRGELLVPQWTMDMVIAGAAFAVTWVDDALDYPHFTRVDPLFCYPDVTNGMMQDLLVVQTIKLRVADKMWPELDLLARFSKGRDAYKDDVEVWDYYSTDYVQKRVSLLDRGGKAVRGENFEVQYWEPDIGCPPAVMAQFPSHDGGFRGMLDQIGGVLQAKDRAVKYMLEYTHQEVFAPFEAKGIVNVNDPPGPTTVYQHDPTVEDSRIGRVQPAGAAPQLFALLQLVDDDMRGSLAYPSSRQGEVPQSIASGSFVAATQGQLSSLARSIQGLLADLRKELTHVTFKLDEKFLDRPKPLIRSIQRKSTYRPSTDIAGRYHVQVVYGAGAGLDRPNADVRVLQYKGAGLISDETAREQIDFLKDASGERDKISQETTARAIEQRFLADPSTPIDALIELHLAQAEGASFTDALKRARAIIQRQQQQAAAQTAEGLLSTRGAPVEPGAEAAGLAAGGIPGALPRQEELLELEQQLTPLEQIFVRN
jgi:hypothetical protein